MAIVGAIALTLLFGYIAIGLWVNGFAALVLADDKRTAYVFGFFGLVSCIIWWFVVGEHVTIGLD